MNARRSGICNGLGLLALCALVACISAPQRNSSSPTRPNIDPSAIFFAQATVHVFKIEIDPAAAASLRTETRKDISALVTADGDVFPDVAIHIKGGPGSLRKFDDKPALTLNFGKSESGKNFFGMRKIHLNNSVQDRSYCNEFLAGELFRAAGVPAPRVAFALVEINRQPRGVYVLKEGFSKDFLARYFKNVEGNLYERGPAGQRARDVNQQMPRNSGSGPDDWSDLQAVASAATEPDLERRWALLQRVLDIDRVLSFMAMEILACHTDGYSLRANNFRIYHDMDTDKLLFFPHGTDQMFARTTLPPEPAMGGLVARAIMQTPQGRHSYRQRFQQLFERVFHVQDLTNRVNYIAELLRPALLAQGPALAASFDLTVAQKINQINQRAAWLERYLSLGEPKPPRFENDIAQLTDWIPWDEAAGAAGALLERSKGNVEILRISRDRPVAASWRARVLLTPGRYRFEGAAQTTGILAPDNRKLLQGACLRIQDRPAAVSQRLVGDTPWQKLECEFDVPALSEVELACELRARQGIASFDLASLRLVRIK